MAAPPSRQARCDLFMIIFYFFYQQLFDLICFILLAVYWQGFCFLLNLIDNYCKMFFKELLKIICLMVLYLIV